jgi:hypothetical protein
MQGGIESTPYVPTVILYFWCEYLTEDAEICLIAQRH